MDTMNQNQMPPVSPIPGAAPKKSSGPLLAVIIILLLIIVGGLYFLGQRMNGENGVPAAGDQVTKDLKTQSSSDDLNSIEADLNATHTDNLDQGASVIESQLQ